MATSNHRKFLLTCTALSAAAPTFGYANPQDGVVAAGSAVITSSGNTVTIDQSSQRAVIDWRSFNIAPNETTRFNQPNSSSHTLNRVNDTSRSVIEGTIQANGNITIINPNGVFFSAGSVVDVSGITVTSADTSNANFMAGNVVHDIAGNADAQIVNHGNITVRDAGLAAFVAPGVENNGSITARLGKVKLAAGETFTLDMAGDGHMQVAVAADELRTQVANSGRISADGGHVQLSTTAARSMVDSLITNTGIVEAKEGRIDVDGTFVALGGTLDASGDIGGTIHVQASHLNQQATINARGTTQGGSITVRASDVINESALGSMHASSTAGKGGTIDVQVTNEDGQLFTSGTYDASGATEGGSVMLSGKGSTKLYAANVKADGGSKAGEVLVGGGYRGLNANILNSKQTVINSTTVLSASADVGGEGGTVVTWSDEHTRFMGTSKAIGGGTIEVSSKETLNIGDASILDASNPWGQAGQVLLDPKNITIATGGANSLIFDAFELVDPNVNGTNFTVRTVLANGNIVITDHTDNIGGTSAGAAYLFSGTTGGLLSTITGSANNDRVGIGGVTTLSNGNYVIISNNWSSSRGAATWASGTTGVAGTVSAANSLVSGLNFSAISGMAVNELTNGNYVVRMAGWNANRGLISWANGNGSTVGVMDNTNSLVGTTGNDSVGANLLALSNGNYVTWTTSWNNGLGAVTLGNGNGGTVGDVSAANSLVGDGTDNRVAGSFAGSGGGVYEVGNSNYVVLSTEWGVDIGAVTWGSGTTGIVGNISDTNSLVGTTNGEAIGSGGITRLTNGNYVIGSTGWNDARGAATWADGNSAITGYISAANSLVGTNITDSVSLGGITALTNGNYVVRSDLWNGGYGAATFGNGATGTVGTVDATNSLVGSDAADGVGNGGVYALSNGNYVVRSSGWFYGKGAVTWASGATGISGIVGAGNSLVGTLNSDNIGLTNWGASDGITLLDNGNFVIASDGWDNGRGAVTFVNGATGMVGAVDATNSLVGSAGTDRVGHGGVYKLTNNNVVVASRYWNGDRGAATWMSGTTGLIGTVGAGNSLVGGSASDAIAYNGITALSNGNYVVTSQTWNGNRGAVTLGNGVTGATVGVVDATNSLVGTLADDRVGSSGITALTNGNYVVNSYFWGGWDTGAVTWGSGTAGVIGTINATNSLIGTTGQVGEGGITALANGHYIVNSNTWNGNLGAMTFGDGTMGTSGSDPSVTNSLFGDNAGATTSRVLYSAINDRTIVQLDNRAYSGKLGGDVVYGFQQSSDVTFSPDFLTRTLNTGAAVTLQANNDITINNDIIANNASGNGGWLTLQAGRSILVNADITTDNGNLTLYANETLASGVIDAERDAGAAVITMGAGADINAGTGTVDIQIKDGAGKTHTDAGDITLRNIIANIINVRAHLASSDIILNSGLAPATSVTLNTLGTLHIDAAQAFGNASIAFTAADYDIAQNISGTSGLTFGLNGDLSLGGAAGTTHIDSVELDRIQNGFGLLNIGANQTGNITMQAYSNWRDFTQIGASGTVTVAGVQSTLGGGAGFDLVGTTLAINADIDFSLGGYIRMHNSASAATLSANLIANGLVDIRRAVTLTGAAGTTHTINAGTGPLIIRNDGGGWLGSIAASGDQHLILRGDDMDIQGDVTAINMYVGAHTTTRSLGLAGAAGDIQLSSTELDHLNAYGLNFGYIPAVSDGSSAINAGAHTWTGIGDNGLGFSTTGLLDFQGAQTFATRVSINTVDLNIGAAFANSVANTHNINIQSSQSSIGLAGAAGGLQLSTAELDNIADGWGTITFGGGHLGTVTANAYSNWRDTVIFNPSATLTIAGTQATAAGSNASFYLNPRGGNASHINGDLDARLSNGSVFLEDDNGFATHNLGANLYGTGITIDAVTNLTGAAGVTRRIDAGTGTLNLRNNGTSRRGSITAANRTLDIVANDADIQGAISAVGGSVNIYTSSNGRTMGLAGGAGNFQLSSTELDLLSAANIRLHGSGLLTMDAHTWTNNITNQLSLTSATGVSIVGAQDFNSASTHAVLFTPSIASQGYNIGAALSTNNAKTLTFNGDYCGSLPCGGAALDVGAGAGAAGIDATELDYIADGWGQIRFGADSHTVNMGAYGNWRDPIRVDANLAVNITGNQAAGAGSDASFTVRSGYANQAGAIINGDIDMSAAANGFGGITLTGYFNWNNTSAHQLGGNLISGTAGITIDRAVELTGAAGTTRTLNANTGTLTIANSAGVTYGSIAAGDKNLQIIADALSLNPTNLTATTGGILLSPYTTGWSIGVGDGGAHDISYSTALVDVLKTNFAHYTFGRSTTGDITNYTAAWDDPVTFLSAGNFTSGVAVTSAPDSFTVTTGGTITLNHALTTSNGAVNLTAGTDSTGNIDINNGAHINAGTSGGAITLTTFGGVASRIFIADADLTGNGITLNNHTTFDGTAGSTRAINAGIGTFTNLANIVVGNRTLNLFADDADIQGAIGAVGGSLSLYTTTAGRTMGLGGGAGDYQLSDAELDLLSADFITFWGSNGTINLDAHDWANAIAGRLVFRANEIIVSGDQNFNSAATHNISLYANGAAGFTMNGALNTNNAKSLTFSGPSTLEIGTGAAASGLNSAELDLIGDGWSNIILGGETNNTTVFAYNNWRDPIQLQANSLLTISGAQAAAAGSDSSLMVYHGYNTGIAPIINANIDMSAAANGYGGITLNGFGHVGAGSAFQLGANLTSGTAGITINRAVELTGAAGTTRTLNANTGTLTIANSAGVTYGSIAAGDKNLVLRGDNMTIGGAITGDSNRTLTLLPYDLTRTMGVGTTAAGLLSINDGELALLDSHSGVLVFGDNTGTGGAYNYAAQIDINTPYDFDSVRFTTTAAGSTRISGDISHTGGGLSFWSPTLINGNRSITNLVDGSGVSFYGTINGVSGGENLTISQRNQISFYSTIGNVNPLGAISLNSTFSPLSLPIINAASLFVRTLNAAADITLNGILNLSGAGTALELVAGDDIINNVGAGVFNLTGGGRFLTWSDDPLEDTGEEHFSAASTKRYNRNYGDAVEPTGNIRNYSIAPTLTITGDNTQFTYGDASSVAGTYAISGWHMAEDQAVHSMGGTATFQTSYVQGDNAGTSYNVSNNGSTLSSNLGYGIGYANSANLTVNKADLRVKAIDLTMTQGNVPVVNFLYEPTDFKLGENAGTAGIVGSASVSNINFATVGAGTYNMQLGFGGLTSTNYSFSELLPRGVLTVNGTATPAQSTFLPDTVRMVMGDARILFTDNQSTRTSGTNNGGGTNAGLKQDSTNSAGSKNKNTIVYDSHTGDKVTSVLSTMVIDPIVLTAFGLTYDANINDQDL